MYAAAYSANSSSSSGSVVCVFAHSPHVPHCRYCQFKHLDNNNNENKLTTAPPLPMPASSKSHLPSMMSGCLRIPKCILWPFEHKPMGPQGEVLLLRNFLRTLRVAWLIGPRLRRFADAFLIVFAVALDLSMQSRHPMSASSAAVKDEYASVQVSRWGSCLPNATPRGKTQENSLATTACEELHSMARTLLTQPIGARRTIKRYATVTDGRWQNKSEK